MVLGKLVLVVNTRTYDSLEEIGEFIKTQRRYKEDVEYVYYGNKAHTSVGIKFRYKIFRVEYENLNPI